MKRFLGAIFKGAHTLYTTTLALVGLTCVVAVAANYTMTQGSGTTFGSLVVGGVNFAQQLICDPTTTSQCAAVNASGQVSIGALPAGTAIVGKVGIDQTTPGTTNAIQEIPGTSGGLSAYFVQPTASDNHANIKNGAGQVYHISVTNNSATVNYLRLYNAGTGFNGCNSATNLVGQWLIPASTSGAGITFPLPTGIAFSTGISICVTSGYATTDTTNATASAMSVNIGYK